jgi:hypothetical protein
MFYFSNCIINMTSSTWDLTIYNAIDKRRLLPGSWQEEPDEVRFTSSVGLLAMIRRNNLLGFLLGYAGVPRSHPLYGKGDRHHLLLDASIKVHGGITYSGNAIKDVDTWWFGFDCGHGEDFIPHSKVAPYSSALITPPKIESYKSISFVTSQIESLALQLAMIKKDMEH